MNLSPITQPATSILTPSGYYSDAVAQGQSTAKNHFALGRSLMPALGATGLAVGALFKPLVAQAQDLGVGATQMAGVWESLSDSGPLVAGALALVGGAWGISALVKSHRERDFQKFLAGKPHAAELLQKLAWIKEKDPQNFQKRVQQVLETQDLNPADSVLILDLTNPEFRAAPWFARLVNDVIGRFKNLSVGGILSAFNMYGNMLENAQRQALLQRLKYFFQTPAATREGWAYEENFKELIHYWKQWATRRLDFLQAFEDVVVEIAASEAMAYTDSSFESFLIQTRELAREEVLLDDWVMPGSVGIRFMSDIGNYRRVIDSFISVNFENNVNSQRDVNLDGLRELLQLCCKSETRQKILNKALDLIKEPEDFFKAVLPFPYSYSGAQRVSLDYWQDYATWCAGNLPEFFKLKPTISQIQTMDYLLGQLDEDLGDQYYREQDRAKVLRKAHFRAASRYALASGQIDSVAKYFELVKLTRRGTRASTQDFASQTMAFFAGLKPDLQKIKSYLNLFDCYSCQRVQALYGLIQLGLVKTPEEYIELTDTAFLFGSPNALATPPINLGGGELSIDGHVKENSYLLRIYQDHFHPLIAGRSDFKEMQKAYLRDNVILTGYVHTRHAVGMI